jgi:ABC-type sugar transport system ATPase subunit
MAELNVIAAAVIGGTSLAGGQGVISGAILGAVIMQSLDSGMVLLGIFLISHDLHDVFDLSDRVSVIKNGKLIGTRRTQDVTKDEVLGMIIMGKLPEAD